MRAAVLEDEAGGAVAQGDLDVLVGVERRRDDHSQRLLHVGAGEESGRGQPVEHGHADVEQADVGSDPLGELDRGPPVVDFADHRHVGLAVDDHAEAGADHRLVVGEQHGDRGFTRRDVHGTRSVVGITARIRHISPSGPAWKVPPSASTRSRMPTRP